MILFLIAAGNLCRGTCQVSLKKPFDILTYCLILSYIYDKQLCEVSVLNYSDKKLRDMVRKNTAALRFRPIQAA